MKEKYPENIEYTSGGSGQNTMRTIAVSHSFFLSKNMALMD